MVAHVDIHIAHVQTSVLAKHVDRLCGNERSGELLCRFAVGIWLAETVDNGFVDEMSTPTCLGHARIETESTARAVVALYVCDTLILMATLEKSFSRTPMSLVVTTDCLLSKNIDIHKQKTASNKTIAAPCVFSSCAMPGKQIFCTRRISHRKSLAIFATICKLCEHFWV